MLSRTQSHRARSPDAGSFFARFAIRSRDGEEADGDEEKKIRKLCVHERWVLAKTTHNYIIIVTVFCIELLEMMRVECFVLLLPLLLLLLLLSLSSSSFEKSK